jgi:hypothetical protein
MANRLEPLNLVSYVGGLNLRADQFQLADDESPDMLNVDIDPRGGFFTRRGWERWNTQSIVDLEAGGQTTWQPRNAYAHVTSTDQQFIYVVESNKLYVSDDTTVFAAITGPVCEANPHGADLAAWGNDVYIACGIERPSYRRRQPATGSVITETLLAETWSEIEAPTHGVMPQAEHVEAHGGYLFVACTKEDDVLHNARVRWSHPGVPDAWRVDDFLDIEAAGGRITAILAFNDHLLIFKTNSLWALYGYDEASWQLVRVSSLIGCPTTTAIGRSETAAYFYSATSKGGIYGYTGSAPTYISENIRPVFEQLLSFENVFVSWAARKLWVTVPWRKDKGTTPEPTSMFVFNPDIGQGAWTMYRSEYGCPAPVLDGSDIQQKYPLSAFWSTFDSLMVTLDAVEEAHDILLDAAVLGVRGGELEGGILDTQAGEDIGISGVAFRGQEFESYYRTRWLHAGWPDRKKSWRRPTLICKGVQEPTQLVVETYRDYNEAVIHRSKTLVLQANATTFWRDAGFDDVDGHGFDWKELGSASPDGRGADWGQSVNGATLVRSGSLGMARAVQLRVQGSPTTPKRRWGVDGIVAKFVMRRFR